MPEHAESVFLAAFFFPSAAAVLVFLMKYVSAVLQARVRLGQDEAYREIAARSVAAQTETATELSSYRSALGEIQARLVTVERILKQVE